MLRLIIKKIKGDDDRETLLRLLMFQSEVCKDVIEILKEKREKKICVLFTAQVNGGHNV